MASTGPNLKPHSSSLTFYAGPYRGNEGGVPPVQLPLHTHAAITSTVIRIDTRMTIAAHAGLAATTVMAIRIAKVHLHPLERDEMSVELRLAENPLRFVR